MGLLKSAMVVAALTLSAPAWADRGYGHDRDDGRGRGNHHRWHGHHHAPAWGHHPHRHWAGSRAPRYAYPPYYGRYYYAPHPSYVYAPPAFGIHIVTPGIYIPFH
jgi:hypothetical protein